MLTEIKTTADLAKLPAYLLAAIRLPTQTRNHRFTNQIQKAERKTVIQNAVVRAIKEQAISFELGKECLIQNKAYGPKGKKALEACK